MKVEEIEVIKKISKYGKVVLFILVTVVFFLFGLRKDFTGLFMAVLLGFFCYLLGLVDGTVAFHRAFLDLCKELKNKNKEMLAREGNGKSRKKAE